MITPFQFLEYCLVVVIAVIACRIGWVFVDAIFGVHDKD
jgi:hypothetical protein